MESSRRKKLLIRKRERAERRERMRQRVREIRCFWTPPFGHAYDHSIFCSVCGYSRSLL